MPAAHDTRHLIYYVYPIKGNGVWQRNVQALKQRADLFNGIRRVIVAEQTVPLLCTRFLPTPERGKSVTTDTVDDVRGALGPGFDVSVMRHNPQLRETAAFQPLVHEAIQHEGVTFFGHAKGVSWPALELKPVHTWTSLCYATNLDYWPLVEKAFAAGKAMVGTLRTQRSAAATKRIAVREGGTLLYKKVFSPASWFYDGTFFWFDNARVRNLPNIEPDPTWLGVEHWPGRMFRDHQTECLCSDAPGLLYDWPVILPLLAKFSAWSEANAQYRREGATAEPWKEYANKYNDEILAEHSDTSFHDNYPYE